MKIWLLFLLSKTYISKCFHLKTLGKLFFKSTPAPNTKNTVGNLCASVHFIDNAFFSSLDVRFKLDHII